MIAILANPGRVPMHILAKVKRGEYMVSWTSMSSCEHHFSDFWKLTIAIQLREAELHFLSIKNPLGNFALIGQASIHDFSCCAKCFLYFVSPISRRVLQRTERTGMAWMPNACLKDLVISRCGVTALMHRRLILGWRWDRQAEHNDGGRELTILQARVLSIIHEVRLIWWLNSGTD